MTPVSPSPLSVTNRTSPDTAGSSTNTKGRNSSIRCDGVVQAAVSHCSNNLCAECQTNMPTGRHIYQRTCCSCHDDPALVSLGDSTEFYKGSPLYRPEMAGILAREGASEPLKRLLKRHPELIHQEFYMEQVDKNKNLLTIAARSGRVQCVQVLIDAGADANKRDRQGSVPLHLAVHSNNKECINMLLAHGAHSNTKNRAYKDTPLHAAAGGYRVNSMQALIEAGAKPDARNKAKSTPLHRAIAFKPRFHSNSDRQVDAVRTLINAGANVNARDIDGCTPLHHAVQHDGVSMEVVEALINARADVNARSKHGTPLCIAARKGRMDCLNALLEAGGDPFAKKLFGSTPRRIAEQAGHHECAERLRRAELER